MAHLYKKRKKGREYYYIRETQRLENRPVTVNQVYLGGRDKLEAIWAGKDPKAREGYSPKEFGSLFVLAELDRLIDLAALIDEILPPRRRSKGPTLGGLLFYAALNRAIAPTSKRQLATWYETTDIQRIRPLRLTSLNSQNFWNYWHRLDESSLEKVITRFFQRVQGVLPATADYLLLVNLPPLPSLASPGKTPAAGEPGKALVRRPGLTLIIQRHTGVPAYYQDCPPDLTPAGFLGLHLNGLLARMAAMGVTVRDLTWVFRPGQAGEEVIRGIDAREGLHFIASLPLPVVPELARLDPQSFRPLPGDSRGQVFRAEMAGEPLRFYETSLPVWGRRRKVLVVFDPRAYRQKAQELKDLGKKLRWRLRRSPPGQPCKDEPGVLEARYQQLCRELHLEPELFRLYLRREKGVSLISLRENEEKITAQAREFAHTLLITDQEDWRPEEIFQAYQGGPFLGLGGMAAPTLGLPALTPQYHWTASKVRINTFVSLVALTYLALLGQRLQSGGLVISPQEAIQEMRALKTAIYWLPRVKKFRRLLQEPTAKQSAIMQALGVVIPPEEVLHTQVSP